MTLIVSLRACLRRRVPFDAAPPRITAMSSIFQTLRNAPMSALTMLHLKSVTHIGFETALEMDSLKMDTCQLFWNEYKLIYVAYEGFNSHFLTLKGWSVSVALAAIIAVYSEKIGTSGKVILWVAALSSLPFWVLDTIWKSYQSAYLDRLKFLEGLGDCKILQAHELGMITGWQKEHEGFDLMQWVEFAYNSGFPHAFVLIAGLVLILRFPPQTTHQDKQI